MPRKPKTLDDVDDRVPIRIEGPLPMHVAGTLMSLIGSAWPEAMIETATERRIALDMRIPNETAKSVDQEFIDQIKQGEEPVDSEFLGFRDGWVAFTPPEDLCLHLGEVCHSILEGSEGAVNYLEWTVRTGPEFGDPSYVVSAARSKGQTPHALRKAADARVEMLEALLRDNGIEVPK